MLVLLHNWVQGFQRSIIFFLYKKKTPAHYSHNVSHRLLIKQKAHTLPWDSVQCTVSRLAFMDMKVPLILANCFCGLCTYLLDSLWAPGPLYPLCTCMWGSLVLHAGGGLCPQQTGALGGLLRTPPCSSSIRGLSVSLRSLGMGRALWTGLFSFPTLYVKTVSDSRGQESRLTGT